MSGERMTDAALAGRIDALLALDAAGALVPIKVCGLARELLEQAAVALRARPHAVAEGMRYAQALVDVMDGTKDYEIQADTGLPDEDCKRIADARRAAKSMLAASQSATGGAT